MVAQIKKLRGNILQFLQALGTTQASEEDIITAYYEYYRPSEIRQALMYLSSRGYIQEEKKPHPLQERKWVSWYRIDADGLNLIEGDIRDVGVRLPPADIDKE